MITAIQSPKLPMTGRDRRKQSRKYIVIFAIRRFMRVRHFMRLTTAGCVNPVLKTLEGTHNWQSNHLKKERNLNMKLYEISNTYKSFLDAVESGEIPEEAITDTLAGIDGEFEDKADNIACYIKSLLSEAQAIKNEVDILIERADAKKHKAERLTDYLYQQFKIAGKTKMETPRNVLQIKNNPPSVQIADADSFTQWAKGNASNLLAYKEPLPDKKAIKQALQDGQQIPGAELVRGDKLAIK